MSHIAVGYFHRCFSWNLWGTPAWANGLLGMGPLERVPGVDELTCSKTEGKNWEHLPYYSRDTLTKRMLCKHFWWESSEKILYNCKLQLHLIHHRCSSFTSFITWWQWKPSAFLSGMLLPTAATPDEVVELAVPAYIQFSVTDSPFISG